MSRTAVSPPRTQSADSSRSSIGIADELLNRLNQALAGGAADETDFSSSLSYTDNHQSSMTSPPSLSQPPSIAITPFEQRPAGSERPATAPRERLENSKEAHLQAHGPVRAGASNQQVSRRPSSAKRPQSTGGLRGWGEGTSTILTGSMPDSVDDEDLNGAEDEGSGDKMLIHLEVLEATSVPAAQARCTGECYVELQRRTQCGGFVRLNPAQSRVKSVKTSRIKRSWGDKKTNERVVSWNTGQSIDVQAGTRDSLILSLWDYKTIGSCLKIGQARLECSDIMHGMDKEVRCLPLCDQTGQDIIGSNLQTTHIRVAVAASPLAAPFMPVHEELSEDASAVDRKASPKKPITARSSLDVNPVPLASLPRSPPAQTGTPSVSSKAATPVLNAMMMKLGSYCEHGGEALTFLGLDGDGNVSARQLAAGMDRLGHPRLDLDALGRELQTVLPGAGAEAFKASNWRLRTDQFLEIFKSRVSKNSIVVGLIPSEIEKEKLRRAEDLIEKKDAEIGSLRSTIAALKEKVTDLSEKLDASVRQEQISFYAAEDAIKKITDLEAAHALLTREIADYKAQNTEARMLKERLEELEARHVGMQEQIDRGNILNARLIQERKGLEHRLEKYEEDCAVAPTPRNWLSETAVGSQRGKQRYALAAALAQLEAAELTCHAIVNGTVFSATQPSVNGSPQSP